MSKVSGKEIIQAIVEDMYEGREELRYSVVPPGIYRIYLHENDYKRLVPIVKHIVDETTRALDEEVDRMNGQSEGTGEGVLINLKGSIANLKHKVESVFQGDFRKRVWKKPAEGWQVAINPDPNEELEPGDLCVNSELMLPTRVELGDGNPTRNLTTIRRKGGKVRTERKYAESHVKPSDVSPIGANRDQTGSPVEHAYARIRYFDEGHEKVFNITKNAIVVGRGGAESSVDLLLHESTKLSREHFTIRRDEESGKFYIKDTSKFGTTVNGVPLVPVTEPRETEILGQRSETELPTRATIELAGSLKIEFEALK